MDAYAKALADHERDAADYRRAVAMLPPHLRSEWARVEASNEYFDGEWWAAKAVLARWLADRRRST